MKHKEISICKTGYFITVERYLGIGVICALFLLVFSFCTSPLTQFYGGDASFFQLVGQGMHYDMLPYRDFFDMKGPYMFLIEYIGQYFCKGRMGCFIVQYVSLFISLLFTDKIHQLALGKKHLVWEGLLMLPYLWVAAATFEGGNLTEEFCLPVLLICLHYYLKYISGQESKHSPLWALIYGAAFGYIMLIRITNAAGICALVLCIMIRLIYAKEYKNLFINAISFVLGLILAIIPAVVYCVQHGILYEMLYTVFAFGYIYAAEGSLFSFTSSQLSYFIPMLIPMIICVFSSERRRYLGDVVVQFITIVLAVSMGNHYPHYFTLAIPFLVMGGYLLARILKENNFNKKIILRFAVILLICLSTIWPKVKESGYLFMWSANSDRYVDYQAQEIGANIPEDEKDSVFAWEIASRFYLETELYPCIKYCDWQEHYIELSPDIKVEIGHIFEQDAPLWVVTENRDSTPEFMEHILLSKYEVYFMNEKYTLYRNTLNTQ